MPCSTSPRLRSRRPGGLRPPPRMRRPRSQDPNDLAETAPRLVQTQDQQCEGHSAEDAPAGHGEILDEIPARRGLRVEGEIEEIQVNRGAQQDQSGRHCRHQDHHVSNGDSPARKVGRAAFRRDHGGHLAPALRRGLDVTPDSTSPISLMRWRYSPFTHRAHVGHSWARSPDVHRCSAAHAERITRRTLRCIPLSGPRIEDAATGDGLRGESSSRPPSGPARGDRGSSPTRIAEGDRLRAVEAERESLPFSQRFPGLKSGAILARFRKGKGGERLRDRP